MKEIKEVFKMKRKDIDTMREVRLWVRDLVIPVTMSVLYIKSNPDIDHYLKDKWENFTNKFRKNPKITIYEKK